MHSLQIEVKKDGGNQLLHYKRAHNEISSNLEQMEQQAVPREEGTHVLKSMLFDLITPTASRAPPKEEIWKTGKYLVPQFKDKIYIQFESPSTALSVAEDFGTLIQHIANFGMLHFNKALFFLQYRCNFEGDIKFIRRTVSHVLRTVD